MDSGDTGTEEVAKKRPNQLPPCGDSLFHPLGGEVSGRSGSLGLLASRSLSKICRCKKPADPRGDQRVGARRIRFSRKRKTCAQACGRNPKLEMDCGPSAASSALLTKGNWVTGCARPRGSARTSRLRCRNSWAVLAPNKFSERAAKTAADESEREPRWRAVFGFTRKGRVVEESSQLCAVAAKGHWMEARPRVAS